MPDPAVYRTESAARAHRRRQLRDAIREEVSRDLIALGLDCGVVRSHAVSSRANSVADRILARYDRIEADQ